MQPARLRLGQLLVDAHIVSSELLEQVLALQKTDGRRLGTLLVESGLVTETQLTQILSQQLSVPWVSLYHIDFSRELLNLVPRDIAERYCLVPIYIRPVRGQGDTLYVAMDDPMNEDALRECSASASLPARPMIAAPSAISKAIRLYYSGSASGSTQAGSRASPSPILAAPAAGAPAQQAVSATPAVQQAMPATATVRSRAEHLSAQAVTPAAAAVAVASEEVTAVSAGENGAKIDRGVVPVAQATVASAPGPLPLTEDDGPILEVREVEINKNHRKRAQLKLTLLDGTTIKVPSGRKHRADAAPESTGEPSAPAGELTAAELLSALRAAAQGADASDVAGANLRWEKIVGAILTLLLRKHLILERELIEELRKI
jgi:type IV pilus assembly protein PilB